VASSRDGAGPRVLLVGPPDVGKTTIARILANYAARQNSQPIYVDLDVSEVCRSLPVLRLHGRWKQWCSCLAASMKWCRCTALHFHMNTSTQYKHTALHLMHKYQHSRSEQQRHNYATNTTPEHSQCLRLAQGFCGVPGAMCAVSVDRPIDVTNGVSGLVPLVGNLHGKKSHADNT